MIKKPAKPSKGNKGKKGKGGRGGGKRDAGSAKKKGGTTSKVGFGKKTWDSACKGADCVDVFWETIDY